MPSQRAASDAQKLRGSLSELPEPVATPFLVMVSGLPGTGKSHFSRQLAEHLPCVVLNSDILRKTLFPSPQYTGPENQRLFSALEELIKSLLKSNIPVLVDATNLVRRDRERLYSIADRLSVKLVIVRVEAPQEVVQERLQTRGEKADPEDASDADLTVYQRMSSRVQRIHRNHFTVDTSKDITPVIRKIIRELKR
ncbi:MAG: AAA family ATPase [Chloroflexota bacterium]